MRNKKTFSSDAVLFVPFESPTIIELELVPIEITRTNLISNATTNIDMEKIPS